VVISVAELVLGAVAEAEARAKTTEVSLVAVLVLEVSVGIGVDDVVSSRAVSVALAIAVVSAVAILAVAIAVAIAVVIVVQAALDRATDLILDSTVALHIVDATSILVTADVADALETGRSSQVVTTCVVGLGTVACVFESVD